MKRLIAVAISVLLAACGSKLSGTYSASGFGGTKVSYEFKSNGKVLIDSGVGVKTDMPYEVDGKNLKLITPQGNGILTIIDDKTIQGPMGMKFVKES